MTPLKLISIKQIKTAIEKLDPNEYKNIDLIIGIGKSGLVFSKMVRAHLKKPLEEIHLKQYSDAAPPKRIFNEPVLLKSFDLNVAGKKILLVDDVCRSGKTLKKAKQVLLGKNAKSVEFVCLVGTKTFCLIKEKECVLFPWQNKTQNK